MGARRVLLHGSVARGDARPGSDIDLVAVFDDLGDYSDRPEIARTAQAGTADAAGCPCEVLVTDRPEWAARVSLATSIESAIREEAVDVVSLPEASPVDWGKEIAKPTTDAAEALADLADASEALLNASLRASATAREIRAAASGALLGWDDERFRRMMFLCGHSHDAVRAALAAFSRGVEQARPARGPGGERVAAVIEGLSRSSQDQFLAAVEPLTPSEIAVWGDPGVFIRSEQTLQQLSPRTAAAIYDAARRCCRISVDAVTARHGHTAWTRELVELLDDPTPAAALHQQTRSPRFARKTYTRRCLVPPVGAPDLPDPAAPALERASTAAPLETQQRGTPMHRRAPQRI